MKKNSSLLVAALFTLLMWMGGPNAIAQELPTLEASANVAGNWTIHSRSDDGRTATQFIQLKQNGNTITGHFKGPHQSGSLEGAMDIRHIVFRTNTREVLTFRGMVTGDTMQGNFGIRGVHGTWEATRTP